MSKRLTGGEAIVRAVLARGVDTVFALPGVQTYAIMDALQRVTGKDLFGPYEKHMNADLALASIAAEKHPGYNRYHQTVVHEASYGQLDYYSPVLAKLAREYRRPIFQHLALWDHSLGSIQKTRYVTPTRKIALLFELGGYAYVWYDPTVPEVADEKRLSYHFPAA